MSPKSTASPAAARFCTRCPPSEGDEPEQQMPDYPVHLFFTREGYFKKITPQSLRMSASRS